MALNDDDWLLVKAAITKGGDIWGNETLEDVKQKIKSYYRGHNGGHCCYCRERFGGGFKMVIDIEHILPKSQFVDFIFEMFNLNISCKRCNMWIKKERVDFIVDPTTVHLDPKNSDLYHFIHPNLDSYFDHMDYEVNIKNETEMVKYIPKKEKGVFAYDFFRLKEKEIDSFNKAQGISSVEIESLLPDQPDEIQQVSEALIERL